MSIYSILLIYSLLIFSASFLGGWLPSLIHMTHTRTQLMMSFVAGLMLGIAIYHLLPHAIITIDSNDSIGISVQYLMAGLLFMFILLRAFHFHQHDLADMEQSHDHDHHTSKTHPLSWTGIAFGLALHTLIDGIALGAAMQADASLGNNMGLLGIGVFIAIVLHKPLDAMSITSLMTSSGWSANTRMVVNILFGLMCPLGAVLFFWGIDLAGDSRNLWVGSALAFSAGVFLCISLSDLLPEVQFHTHDRGKLTISLLLGISVAYGIGYLEPKSLHVDNHSLQQAMPVKQH